MLIQYSGSLTFITQYKKNTKALSVLLPISPFNLNNGPNNVGVLPGLNNARGDLVINLSTVGNRISLPNSADVLIGEDIPPVPEPLTTLGTLSALGIGAILKRKTSST